MKFHSEVRNYVCDLCGKGFLLEHLLANHRQSMHSSREEKEKGRRFVCTYCAKGFFSKSALQEHEFLHSEKKNFGCDVCGMTFKQSSGLRAHHNRHHRYVPSVSWADYI
jgi:DNA-directed RNA polymerase subunit RPC12/RpoP